MRNDLSCLIDCRICRSSGSLGTPWIFDSLLSQFFQCFNVSNWNWTHCANPGHEFLMSQMSLLVSHIPDRKRKRKISWVTELHMLRPCLSSHETSKGCTFASSKIATCYKKFAPLFCSSPASFGMDWTLLPKYVSHEISLSLSLVFEALLTDCELRAWNMDRKGVKCIHICLWAHGSSCSPSVFDWRPPIETRWPPWSIIMMRWSCCHQDSSSIQDATKEALSSITFGMQEGVLFCMSSSYLYLVSNIWSLSDDVTDGERLPSIIVQLLTNVSW